MSEGDYMDALRWLWLELIVHHNLLAFMMIQTNFDREIDAAQVQSVLVLGAMIQPASLWVVGSP